MGNRPLVITGPTATGKSALAVAVARRLDGEVISMDSRQIYRGMDIGTAKPTLGERGGIPHHGFDLLEPDQRYSAGAFARDARRWIGEIQARSRVPVLAGGTGFFLRALVSPLFAEPPLDECRRDRLGAFLEALPSAELGRWAAALDPAAAAPAGTLPRQRATRILEIALLSGRPLSWWHRHAAPPEPPLDPAVFVLMLPREELYARIDRRVERMMATGLPAEVRALLDRGYRRTDPGLSATGYRETLAFLEGSATLEATIAGIQAATRAYARRQVTWLRHQLRPGAVQLDANEPIAALVEKILAAWTEEVSTEDRH